MDWFEILALRLAKWRTVGDGESRVLVTRGGVPGETVRVIGGGESFQLFRLGVPVGGRCGLIWWEPAPSRESLWKQAELSL